MSRDREELMTEFTQDETTEQPGGRTTPLDRSLEDLRRVRDALARAATEADNARDLLMRAREASQEGRDPGAIWTQLASVCGVLDQAVESLATDCTAVLDRLVTLGSPLLMQADRGWDLQPEPEIDTGELASPAMDSRDTEITQLRAELDRLTAALEEAQVRVFEGGLAHVIGAIQPGGQRSEHTGPFEKLNITAGVREQLTVVLAEPALVNTVSQVRTLSRDVELALDQYLIWDDFICERSEVSNSREDAAMQAGAPFGALLGMCCALHPEEPLTAAISDLDRIEKLAREHGAPDELLAQIEPVFRRFSEGLAQGRSTFTVDSTLRRQRIAQIGGTELEELELHLDDVATEVAEALQTRDLHRWHNLLAQISARAELREDAAFQAGIQLGIPIGTAAALFPGESMGAIFSSPHKASRVLATLGYQLNQLPALVQLTLRTVFEGQALV